MRILVVDDEKIKRITLADDLATQGHDVISAADGQEALDQLRTGRFDVVVTDLKMPGMSGLEFIENQIRLGCRGQTINTAVMSGGWTDEELARAEKLGCRVFHKPFDLGEFISWVAECEERIDPDRLLTPMFLRPPLLAP